MSTELPIACSLSAGELPVRQAQIAKLGRDEGGDALARVRPGTEAQDAAGRSASVSVQAIGGSGVMGVACTFKSTSSQGGEVRDATLSIGEVARRTGTTPRTIRYYEDLGLLPAAAGREPGTHRLYAESDVERLQELLRLKELLGVSLEELRELVEAEDTRAALRREWHSGVEDPVRRRQILEQALTLIARQLELVRRRRDEIAALEGELAARRRRIRSRLRELAEHGAERSSA